MGSATTTQDEGLPLTVFMGSQRARNAEGKKCRFYGGEAATFSVDGKVLILDESNIDSTIATFDHILVDFYAP
ncbi:unnamed protein product [Sphenostylis stenocarpa]|uniref:Uncharacterized protein n=1 Tax=Sphenostylis stenocarpa TaxID=92480 RepID=A0AA86S6R5_9FABA|nr:unnamed protein product [Sphenostylis stenocarpa]